jgi:predicted alpha/beta-fold hydrolase
VVLLHGLAGCSESAYALEAAHACHRAGLAALRLNLRGADEGGSDFYHAGLTADLHGALDGAALSGFREILLLGFSLGGHLVLRAATEPTLDPRVTAVAAVCSPLDLAPCAATLDRPGGWPYRAYLLTGLKRIYRRVASRRQVPLAVQRAERIRFLVEWDERIVAPRFGFAGAWDYYRQASVAPRLPHLRVPALLVAAREDPLIPASSLERVLDDHRSTRLEVRWVEPAGHLGFPSTCDLGEDAAHGLLPQVLGWLERWRATRPDPSTRPSMRGGEPIP